MKILSLLLLLCFPLAVSAAERPALVIVLVIDGLRPDSITPEVTPHLDQLKRAGVWYTHSHSVFPTVTRVNATTISTGTLPSQHGIVSNSVYLPTVAPNRVLSNGDYRNLLSLGKVNGGRVVGPKSLEEYFHAAGVRYVAISSGSTGNALLLNPTAPFGQGDLINPGFEGGARVAFPDELSATLLSRFGSVKGEEGDEAIGWTERVLREYVLETMHPQVVVDWMGRTDSAQHASGVGSPQGLAALRLVDREIGQLQDRLRQMQMEDKTDIIVTCDHGFDYEPGADLLAPLREANFATGEVVVDNEGGSSLFYVKDHDAAKISRLVAKFQASETTNSIFVAATPPANGAFRCVPNAVKGFVPGTFALELAHQCAPTRGADVIVTYRWDATPSPFGVPGTQWIPAAPGSQAAPHNGHGGLNPFVTHSTLLAAGPHFAQGKVIELPAGNVDIAPTLMRLEGLPVPASMDGRVLSESFKNSATAARAKAGVRSIKASSGAFCSELEVSHTGDHTYLNQARRCPGKR